MIAIVDYDAGNTFNVQKAFAYLGIPTVLTADKEIILTADGVVVPGVGAFKQAMETLTQRGLVPVLQEVAAKETPLLGICLGMQILFESSTEYGKTAGLGLIPGTVEAIPTDLGLMVPHTGWNQNRVYKPASPFSFVDKEYTYFVHSYYACCEDEYIVATADYGVTVPSIVGRGSIYGMQFHPEKSAAIGLRLLKQFGSLCGAV
ncbi:imidazole glycerol phosphate synthase subunit HisH [Veillonella sp.]|uniref:imidazole glycerol phosphate synthase subunit HisH n=1 Tax=Veillonella sp. TaxID=1926307 RepID=UPI0025D691D4|nr:imidazole glycerol phosphate synthase subunit HisH [Veillonella sp.]